VPNLPDIIEIGYSWKRLVVLLAGGIALTAGSAAMAFHLFPDMHVDAFYTAVGYFGVVFFGFAMLKIGWLLLTARGPVLFIDRNGIRDLRVSQTVIPWDAVEQIGIGEVKRQQFVTLKVTPALEATCRECGPEADEGGEPRARRRRHRHQSERPSGRSGNAA
jgi:hypothetical protein